MKQYGILAALFTLAAVILTLDNALGVGMMLFAIMVLFNFLLFVLRYRTGKKKFHKEIAEILKVYDDQPSFTITMSLDDNTFSYRDHLVESKTKWEAFRHYTISNDTLFFGFTPELHRNYSISSDEIGAIEFEKVIAFVTQKIVPAQPS
jgi:hypothetical protein